MLEERHGHIFFKYSFFDTLSNICNGVAVKIILGGPSGPPKSAVFGSKMTIFLHLALKRPTNDQISEGNVKYYLIQHIFFSIFQAGRPTMYIWGPGAPLKRVLLTPKMDISGFRHKN